MSRTVLCADADRRLCQILARALGAEGHRVVAAHDGDAALRAVAAEEPGIAVLDLALPGRDGLAVLKALRARPDGRARMPVLLLAGAPPSTEQTAEARALGVAAVLAKPVALEDVVSHVGRLLAARSAEKRGAGDGSKREPQPRPAPARSALRGSLADLAFPALVHEIHGLRASGVLRLVEGAKRKEIQLLDGRPAAVRSNLPPERLGDWLLRSKRITQAAFTESIRRMHRGEGLQGEVLVAMQALSEVELVRALVAQADEKLFEIFEWREGSFELVLNARVEHASPLAAKRSAAEVIRIGVETRFSLERIDAVLARHAENVALRSANPFYSFQEILLGSDARALLEEGARGVAVAGLLVRPPAQRRIAYVLLETGLLELREGTVVRAGGPAPRVRLHPTVARARHAAATAPAVAGPATRKDAGAKRGAASAPVAAPQASATSTADIPEHSHYASDHEQRSALAALLVRLRKPSPFEKLGLRPDASVHEIRAAYTELAKQTHPDRFASASQAVRGLAEEAFREVTRAHERLADPERLEAYRQDPNRDARDARAVEEAQRALAAEQEFQRGETRLRVYDWAGALAHFERAVEMFPEEGEYYAYCGWAYYLTHGHAPDVLKTAFDLVKRGAKLAPDRDKPYLFLGRLAQAAGRLDLAEKMFMHAVERRPDCTEALRELRLLAMRKPRKGIVRRLLARAPDRKRSGRKEG